MNDITDDLKAEAALSNLPLTSESIGFAPDQLVSCGSCSKSNAPDRLKCLYCGAGLPVSETNLAEAKLVLRKLESWESGFNLIFMPPIDHEKHVDIAAASKLLSVDQTSLNSIWDLGKPMPIARVESSSEAQAVKLSLEKLGIKTTVLDDEAINTKKLPVRLRGIEFDGDDLNLRLFNSDDVVRIQRNDFVLIVTGTIFEGRRDEVTKRKKGMTKVLDQIETGSDESVIDIYSRKNGDGWRIFTKGFDFSCLGSEKGMLASKNIGKLAEKLREICTAARFDEDYGRIRNSLDMVWEIETRKDSQGLRRHGFGKLELGNTVTSTNLSQFTKYSRMLWHLL